jgi:hypothetical protein
VLVDASTVVAVRRVSVLSLLCTLCADTCTYTSPLLSSPPPPFFFLLFLVVYVAVLTGTASFFFFFHTLHIYRPGTIKIIIQTIDRCVYMVFLSRRVIQSDTRLQTAQRLALLHGKEPVLHSIIKSLDRTKKS